MMGATIHIKTVSLLRGLSGELERYQVNKLDGTEHMIQQTRYNLSREKKEQNNGTGIRRQLYGRSDV